MLHVDENDGHDEVEADGYAAPMGRMRAGSFHYTAE